MNSFFATVLTGVAAALVEALLIRLAKAAFSHVNGDIRTA